MGNAIVTFDLRKGTIVVEGPTDDLTRLFEAARAAAPALREIRVVASEAAPNAPSFDDDGREEVMKAFRRRHVANTTVARFAHRLPTSNTSERIAVIAFHAIRECALGYFTVEDMSRWFQQCGFPRPSNMNAAMADAQRGRYEYIQNEGRNQWTITPRGERLVREMLEGAGVEDPGS